MIIFFISVTSHALDPSFPVTNCHTCSDPLEHDVLYGRPLSMHRSLHELNVRWCLMHFVCALHSFVCVYFTTCVLGFTRTALREQFYNATFHFFIMRLSNYQQHEAVYRMTLNQFKPHKLAKNYLDEDLIC